ncbi:MAG: NUDIX domain-containing protein [Prevotellaceae bacterium]|jgi:hypothetical protein|nr:NUDIX domain-containing protein [Prevotellaceae bacterium]
MEIYSATRGLYPHVSVDCVIFGFDGQALKVLLMSRRDEAHNSGYNDYKFPGSLVYANEDLDTAAVRAAHDITGLRDLRLRQFRTFGAPDRASSPRDKRWLENATRQQVGRIVTVGYLTLIKMGEEVRSFGEDYNVAWFDVGDSTVQLAFDHPLILAEALREIRRQVASRPAVVFDLLPPKFTARELRAAYSAIFSRTYDVRNFNKKFIENEPLIVALDEKERNVKHRAARYLRFDRKAYARQLTIDS